MLKLTLSNKQKAEMPNSWEELRMKDWIWVLEKINSYGLTDELDEDMSDDDRLLEETRREVEWLKCSKEIFSKLSKLPMDIVNNIHQSDVLQIVNGMKWFMEEERPDNNLSKFELKGEVFYFPSLNMEHSTFEDFVEASQLDLLNKNIKLGRMSVVAKQMAILCRKEGETFEDVDKVIEKRIVTGKQI